MIRNFNPSPADATANVDAVLALQGVPVGAKLPKRVYDLVDAAFERFAALVQPRLITKPVSREEFAHIYQGEGLNDEPAPVAGIAAEADRLKLFALTVGPAVSDEIPRLFADDDPALGTMLDAVASAGAEKLCRGLAQWFQDELRMPVLPYSPGYCGWHVSGQRRLFAALQPGEIGISLTDSHLMHPLKSVSGVLVGAPVEAHEFDIEYAFCGNCKTQDCRERILSLARLPKRDLCI